MVPSNFSSTLRLEFVAWEPFLTSLLLPNEMLCNICRNVDFWDATFEDIQKQLFNLENPCQFETSTSKSEIPYHEQYPLRFLTIFVQLSCFLHGFNTPGHKSGNSKTGFATFDSISRHRPRRATARRCFFESRTEPEGRGGRRSRAWRFQPKRFSILVGVSKMDDL